MLAAVTVAIVAPKSTTFFTAPDANPVPVIVTDAPIGPLDGLKELITGACAKMFCVNASHSKQMYTLMDRLLKARRRSIEIVILSFSINS
jgi:hypothetical protein